MKVNFITGSTETKTLLVTGFYHSNSVNGKYTKAQKKFIKIENGKIWYVGNKRFIKPIIGELDPAITTKFRICEEFEKAQTNIINTITATTAPNYLTRAIL